ncbi:transmembrane 6 superfamily member 1-like [Periophthalmus magnuspinnatus]|uniref:transmembrane 6 superfamily member 1-like n=1 Tax=Periophthalmus magnuspinnatus TaxID=409849 RepID=UPI00243658B0|nr:transmembrane 6 superfamily member 1-like [Periophthalmus magnuspinnatus]
MSASAGTGVFVFSLTSIPICYLCNSLICNDSAEALFYAGCATFVTLCISGQFILNKKAPSDPLFYVYAVFAFLSVVNLIIGLEQDNIIDGFVTFYLKEADPHINTAHGHMISYWDGCVHYLMYLLVIAAITWGDSYRSIGLYWVGSFLMRAIVYILGNTVGKYGLYVGPLSLLYGGYIFIAVWACFRIFSQPSTQQTLTTETQRKRLSQRPTDMLFVIYLIPAFAFCVFRGLIALDCSGQWCQDYALQFEPYLKDPTAYPKVQMLVSLLYSGPYYFLALYALIVPGCGWMPDLTLVHSGALAQAQFSHIGASLHTRTPFSFRVPLSSQPLFLLVNVIYALVPQLLCYRCSTQPEFFLSTRTTSDKKTE